MFTGLIERVGTVVTVFPIGQGKRVRISAEFDSPLTDGESVAVDGACLTLSELERGSFWAEVSRETLNRTTFGKLKRGDKVNLERSLKVEGRIGGHIVQGHVDCVGKVLRLQRDGDFATMTVLFPHQYAKYLVEKGSVAVAGVSLTVSKIFGDRFEATLIPETLKCTTFGEFRPGMEVNLEFDIIAKYVEQMMK